jgi:tetratricopeptide (TPR) repeat protein
LVFTKKDVADFINTNYVALKLDGDSDLGNTLRKQFKIPGYPTTVLFSANGDEIDRIVGFNGKKDEYFQMVKDYTEGRNTLDDLLTKVNTPEDCAQLNFDIANKYNDRGDEKTALKYFEKVLALESDKHSKIYSESEYFVAETKTFSQDDPSYLQQYAKNCSNPHRQYYAYSSLARFFRLKKERVNVIATYEEALTRLPENASMMNSYAWYIFQNRVNDYYERGIEVARKAVALEPEADSIWDTLGQLLFAAGYKEEAIAAMQRAVELAPDETSYQENLKRYKAGSS